MEPAFSWIQSDSFPLSHDRRSRRNEIKMLFVRLKKKGEEPMSVPLPLGRQCVCVLGGRGMQGVYEDNELILRNVRFKVPLGTR